LIAECLIDFLQDFESKIDVALALKLQSHRTSYRRKLHEEKSAKMDVNQIRNFRKLLTAFHSPSPMKVTDKIKNLIHTLNQTELFSQTAISSL
jgi:hypothetical protein